MEKPKGKTMTWYDWHEAVNYLEERYEVDLSKQITCENFTGDFRKYLCDHYWFHEPKDEYIGICFVLIKQSLADGLDGFVKIAEAFLHEFGYIDDESDWTCDFYVEGTLSSSLI